MGHPVQRKKQGQNKMHAFAGVTDIMPAAGVSRAANEAQRKRQCFACNVATEKNCNNIQVDPSTCISELKSCSIYHITRLVTRMRR
jgi:hypothetical protein